MDFRRAIYEFLGYISENIFSLAFKKISISIDESRFKVRLEHWSALYIDLVYLRLSDIDSNSRVT